MKEILLGVGIVFDPTALSLLVLGTFVGIVVGAIPGLTIAMLLSLTLPLTFYLDGPQAIILLIAMTVGGVTGGFISATLLRIPGTPASIATTFDGFPMARGGQPGRALSLGIGASFFGGVLAWVALVSLSKPLAWIGLRLTNFDIFALILMALVMVAAMGERSVLRGVASGLLGWILAMPGSDPITGSLRLTFGSNAMIGGFSVLVVIIGIFAGNQILRDVIERKHTGVGATHEGSVAFAPMSDFVAEWWNMIRSSAVGFWIGILPGLGANVASLFSYSVAKRVSRQSQRYGTGHPGGIIASESANNACTVGSLVPLLALGIPGSIVCAILIGALIVHGVVPGPMLFNNHPDIAGAIIVAVLLAHFVMVLLMVGGIRLYARLSLLPHGYILPIIFIFCVIGCFAVANRWFDVWIMLSFSLLGFSLEKTGFPIGPFVIGFILQPIAETHLRTGMMITGGELTPMLQNPLTASLLLVAAITLVWALLSGMKEAKGLALEEQAEAPPLRKTAGELKGQMIVAALMALFALLVYMNSYHLRPTRYEAVAAGTLPASSAILLAVLAVSVLAASGWKLLKLRGATQVAPVGQQGPASQWFDGVVFAMVALVYVWVLAEGLASFWLATAIVLSFLIAWLQRSSGWRLAGPIAIGLAVGVGCQFLFIGVFFVNLPT